MSGKRGKSRAPQKALYGQPIPIEYGRTRSAPDIIWYENFGPGLPGSKAEAIAAQKAGSSYSYVTDIEFFYQQYICRCFQCFCARFLRTAIRIATRCFRFKRALSEGGGHYSFSIDQRYLLRDLTDTIDCRLPNEAPK